MLGLYAALYIAPVDWGVRIAIWAMLGFFSALVAVNVGHDAIHGAYASTPRANHFLSHTFNFLGASAYMWKRMHNQAHHTYTNVEGHDEDIHTLPLIRFAPAQKRWSVHRFQFIYAYFFYSLGTISWVFVKDYVKFFQNKVGKAEAHTKGQMFWLFFYKACNYTIFLVLPLIFLPDAVWQILLGFVVMHLIEGLWLALIFAMAHVVDLTEFPEVDKEKNQLPMEFAEHQLRTTANFSTRSPLMTWLAGGLNFQVEHHLFPHISHGHYMALSPIIEQTAKECGLPYHVNGTFGQALKSHTRFMYLMGRYDNPVPVTQRKNAVSEAAEPRTITRRAARREARVTAA